MKVYSRVCDRNNSVISKMRSIIKKECKGDCQLNYVKEVTAVDRSDQPEVMSQTFDAIDDADICVFVTDPFGGVTLQALFEYTYACRTKGKESVYLVKPPYLWTNGKTIGENRISLSGDNSTTAPAAEQ